jgi:hypothetical protein
MTLKSLAVKETPMKYLILREESVNRMEESTEGGASEVLHLSRYHRADQTKEVEENRTCSMHEDIEKCLIVRRTRQETGTRRPATQERVAKTVLLKLNVGQESVNIFISDDII